MTELDLKRLGFFEIEKSAIARRFKIFESYKGVFLRVIISMREEEFSLEHISFGSPDSDELLLKSFGNDLSVRNIISKIAENRR